MLDLTCYLARRRTAIETALDERLPRADEPPARLHAAMRHGVLSGAKRLRPILCLAAAETAGGSADAAMPAALAVELFHSYTLIHDDLPCMDDDDQRRGRPSTHAAFGAATALLAGDALQALAFEVLVEVEPAGRYPTAWFVRELALAAGSRGVVGGQADDLAPDAVATDALVESVHLRKTAVLFRTALSLGAMAADAPAAQLAALQDYGTRLGLAFQLVDDLRDAQAGAPGGAAPRDGMNCLAVMTAHEAAKRVAALLDGARDTVTDTAAGPGRDALLTIADLVRTRVP